MMERYTGYRINSNGFEGRNKIKLVFSCAEVAIAAGEARPSFGWYESLIFDKLVKASGVGQKAWERVLRKDKEKRHPVNTMVVVDPMNVSQLLRPLVDALWIFLSSRKILSCWIN